MMSPVLTEADLFNAAMALPQKSRLELAEKLLSSVEKPPGIWDIDDPKFGAELDRRMDELESGKTQAVEWTTVKQNIREMLRQGRGAS